MGSRARLMVGSVVTLEPGPVLCAWRVVSPHPHFPPDVTIETKPSEVGR